MAKKKLTAIQKGHLKKLPLVYGSLDAARREHPVVKQRPRKVLHHKTSMYPK
ncbi:MAG TPA: hypothetical protein PLB89_05270 [Flavobacteriales bacterium]|nr:hypothetical protein [Flavobacteriales bacterium]